MDGLYLIFGGMALFATVIGVLDILGRRHDRQKRRADQPCG